MQFFIFSKGYGQQLTECRESLEQLDGFQSQELAKVKHMLLSAETSLQLEKDERLKLRAQLEELQKEPGNGEMFVSSTNKSDVGTTTSNAALDCVENAINLVRIIFIRKKIHSKVPFKISNFHEKL